MADDDIVHLIDDSGDEPPPDAAQRWKVAVIDDEPAVHDGTRRGQGLGARRRTIATFNPDRCGTCGGRSVVKDDAQQRAVHLEPAVVFDQPELAELVHEEVHPGARRADHFRERLL